MKTYTRYTETTPKEALLALAENDGKPVDGFTCSALKTKIGPLSKTLLNYDCVEKQFVFQLSNGIYTSEYCARVEKVNPREVPEGVTPLPENKPWLAYVGTDWEPLPKARKYYYIHSACRFGWGGYGSPCGGSGKGVYHWAIDVRTDFAKEHFPEIVEAMEYNESSDAFFEWWNTFSGPGDPCTYALKGWEAAIKWKESQ